jgi:hypothetical protein
MTDITTRAVEALIKNSPPRIMPICEADALIFQGQSSSHGYRNSAGEWIDRDAQRGGHGLPLRLRGMRDD